MQGDAQEASARGSEGVGPEGARVAALRLPLPRPPPPRAPERVVQASLSLVAQPRARVPLPGSPRRGPGRPCSHRHRRRDARAGAAERHEASLLGGGQELQVRRVLPLLALPESQGCVASVRKELHMGRRRHHACHRRRRQRCAHDPEGARGCGHQWEGGHAGGRFQRLCHCTVLLPPAPPPGPRQPLVQAHLQAHIVLLLQEHGFVPAAVLVWHLCRLQRPDDVL
mmetsp:Transcript_22338/g.56067  ORF Transcript_22338/g.56067 Transcript_22338/m.56067 type:complete len:226 (+) Transcript_22338:242-919(+)